MESQMIEKASGWIDMHAHLDKLEDPVEVSLQKAQENGVHTIVTIGTEPQDHPIVFELARKYYPQVFCTLGVHPHEGGLYSSAVGEWIESRLNSPWVIAVGEIGLDYFYEYSDKKSQQESFRAQLEIAARHQMPVEIHTRDAEEDTVRILEEFRGRVRGLIHCFTGTAWLAEKALDLGFNISISGVVTFKNADPLREIVKSLPLDRIHVETDAPFLSPVPMRGLKNTPAFVVHTATKVAELKGISLDELRVQTRKNAHKMFPRLA